MDVVIISTASPRLAHYWKQRLEQTRGIICAEHSLILVVHEDWPGGAGNALGTLYAYQKAAQRAREMHGIDLEAHQASGASVALYHTAGKGTRLAPLPSCEGNNKPAVKLPSLIPGSSTPLTILEAVIRQTATYSPSSSGRLAVFWGDQVFLPSTVPSAPTQHCADILMRRLPGLPCEDSWQKLGLANYGLIIVHPQSSQACQVEKIDYKTYSSLIERELISSDSEVGISLGSFSLSLPMLQALLEEFTTELTKCEGKLDSDPHLWMPLTLDEETYLSIMESKHKDLSKIRTHYARMQYFKEKRLNSSAILTGIDVGMDSYWWDFGQVGRYYEAAMKLTEKTEEAQALHHFLSLGTQDSPSSYSHLTIDDSSHLLDCQIDSGHIENSVLIGVKAQHVTIKNSVVIQLSAPSLSCEGALLYQVVDDRAVTCDKGEVRADVLDEKGSRAFAFYTRLERDGKEDWSQTLEKNPFSYEELYAHSERL